MPAGTLALAPWQETGIAAGARPGRAASVAPPVDRSTGGPATETTTYTSIADYVPVTDAMLRDPDPDDWLMYRRTYDGWGYSPLDQSTRDNVHQLALAWVWSMPAGTNQPTPLVHDGVMYLANPDNVIQALDAASGTLLWEYHRALPVSLRTGLIRNLAIYEDTLFLASRDAYLVALDARTGDLGWETRLGTSAQGVPVTFRAGGEQYIAVAPGVGGGSPRRAPTILSPEIHYPATGNALYVFKLAGSTLR